MIEKMDEKLLTVLTIATGSVIKLFQKKSFIYNFVHLAWSKTEQDCRDGNISIYFFYVDHITGNGEYIFGQI